MSQGGNMSHMVAAGGAAPPAATPVRLAPDAASDVRLDGTTVEWCKEASYRAPVGPRYAPNQGSAKLALYRALRDREAATALSADGSTIRQGDAETYMAGVRIRRGESIGRISSSQTGDFGARVVRGPVVSREALQVKLDTSDAVLARRHARGIAQADIPLPLRALHAPVATRTPGAGILHVDPVATGSTHGTPRATDTATHADRLAFALACVARGVPDSAVSRLASVVSTLDPRGTAQVYRASSKTLRHKLARASAVLPSGKL